MVEILRTSTGLHGTFGVLIAPGFRCRTLEPPWRDNRPNISCIPAGEYECAWHYSRKFGWCYIINKVPGRSHILIHPGNLGGDRSKGLRTHTYGCILPGKYDGRLGKQKAVLCSRFTVSEFNRLMAK